MWIRLHSFLLPFVFVCSVVAALPFDMCQSFAQDAPAGEKSARERDLRDQLQNILHELDELQQQPEAGTSVAPPPPAAVQQSIEPTLAEPIPQYELSDVSIVSNRVQRRPEGITFRRPSSRRPNRSRPGRLENQWNLCLAWSCARPTDRETSASPSVGQESKRLSR